jgi:uncharacterized membrane protein
MVWISMSLRDPFLIIHVVAATGGLVLGPVAMKAAKRRGRHTRAGSAYHWLMLATCVSAVGMAVLDWGRIWWFVPIAVFSYANALLGFLAVTIRWRGWLREHIAGMSGSYIALVSALIVVNAPKPAPLWLWFLPTLIGTPLIFLAIARVSRGPLGRLTQRNVQPSPRYVGTSSTT